MAKFLKDGRMYETPTAKWAVDIAVAADNGVVPQWKALTWGGTPFDTKTEAVAAAQRWLDDEPAAAIILRRPNGNVRLQMPTETAWSDETDVAAALTKAAAAL